MILLLVACGTRPPSAPLPRPEQADVPKPSRSPMTRLAALVPTSGSAEGLLDDDPSRGWKPVGDPRSEGVLFRFEKPAKIDAVLITACAGTEPFALTPFYNGTQAEGIEVDPSGRGAVDRVLRSVFLRVDSGAPCIGDVRFERSGKRLPIAPPRSRTGSVVASSTLEPVDAYHPSYLFDSRLDFGWVEGSKGLGVAEVLTVQLDERIAFDKLEIWNGYQRSQDHFDKNARLKKIALTIGGARQEFSVDSERFGPQLLSFASPVKGDTITMEILEAAPGSKYRDLVISELRIWDTEGPFALAVTGGAQRAAKLKNSVKRTAIGPMVDHLYHGYCDGDGFRWLKLRSDHSFVWYEEVEDSTEIFDGAWVPRGAVGTGSRAQLYGRRHRSEASWQPYRSDNGRKESTKIGGGKPVFYPVKGMTPAAFRAHIDVVQQAFGRGCDYELGKLAALNAVIVRDPSMVDVLVAAP